MQSLNAAASLVPLRSALIQKLEFVRSREVLQDERLCVGIGIWPAILGDVELDLSCVEKSSERLRATTKNILDIVEQYLVEEIGCISKQMAHLGVDVTDEKH